MKYIIFFLLSIGYAQAQSNTQSPMIIQRGLTSPAQQGLVLECTRNIKPPPDCGINLNTANNELMLKVPGIDMTNISKIIKGRPYGKPAELMDRSIIPAVDFDKMRHYLWTSGISLNTSSPDEMIAEMGITQQKAKYIVEHRPWHSKDDLVFQNVLTVNELEKYRNMITIR